MGRVALGAGSRRKEIKSFTDVDFLLNVKNETRRYTGLTDDLQARLKSHNQEEQPLSIQVPSLAN